MLSNTRWLIGVLVLAVGGVGVALTAPPAELRELQVGAKAPEFTLKDTDGGETTLSKVLAQASVKAVVVEFIATRCPVSNDYDARMVQLHEEFAPEGVAFMGVNSNSFPEKAMEDVEEIRAHKAKKGIPFPVLKDYGHVVGDQWGARVTPHMYVLDKQGAVRYVGAIDDSQNAEKVTKTYLRDAIEAVLAGTEVAVTGTKGFGCAIKRDAKKMSLAR